MDGTSEKVEKYYFFASLTVAMRMIENGTDTLQWLLADHLGSTSVTASDDGTLNSLLKYSAFGEIWASNGVTNTEYLYTGQLSQAEIGLNYYNARWYDPQLGRFVQADTIVPEIGNATAYDRYAYVLNNPIKNNDPSGHTYCDFGVCPKPRGTSDELDLARSLVKKGTFPNISEAVSKIIKTTSAIHICGGYNLNKLDDGNPNDPNPFIGLNSISSTSKAEAIGIGVISAASDMAINFSNIQIMKQYYEKYGNIPNVLVTMYYSEENEEISIYGLAFANYLSQEPIATSDLYINYVERIGFFEVNKTEQIPVLIDKWAYGKFLPNTPVFVQFDPKISFSPSNSITNIFTYILNTNRENTCYGTMYFDIDR